MNKNIFKITIFGDGFVGKTTLTERFITGLFNVDTKITIGTNFYSKNVKIEDINTKLQIWDFGGEKRFRTLFPHYVRGSNAAIFMFDVTRTSSLESLPIWMNILKKGLGRDHNTLLYLVGGKIDLVEERKISKEHYEKFGYRYNFKRNFECSAKSSYNVEEIFNSITIDLLDHMKTVNNIPLPM